MERRHVNGVALITVAGLAGRLALLAYEPLWRDEAFTALAVQRPLGSMLDVVRNDSAPPLFYLLERVAAFVSTSPAALRLIPALLGAAAIPLGAAIARRVAGERGAIGGAIVCALSPALVSMSLDARMYVLATTLVLASTLALLRALERPAAARFAVYAVLSVLMLHTVYFALFALAGQVVAVLLLPGTQPWRCRVAVSACAVLAVLSLAPWLVAASAQLTHTQGAFWVPALSIPTLFGGLEQFFTGPPVNDWVPGFAALRTLEVVGDAAGLLLLVTLVVERRRLDASGSRTAAFIALACGSAVGAMILASVWHPLEDGRYMSAAWAAMYPLLGAGLALVRARSIAVAAVATTAAATTATSLVVIHPQTPQAVATLGQAGTNVLVAASPSEYLLVLYYADGALAARTHVLATGEPWFWGTAVYPHDALRPPSAVVADATTTTVWYVSEPGDPPAPLASGYVTGQSRCWIGVCVTILNRSE